MAEVFKDKVPALAVVFPGNTDALLSLIGTFYTVKIGDAVNWSARIALYLMGIYFLMAVLIRNPGLNREAGLSERWADAFSNNPEQLVAFLSSMSEGVAYGRVIVDDTGRPIDFVYLDINSAYEDIQGLTREMIIGRRVTELYPGLEKDPSDFIGINGRVALTGEPSTYESYSPI